MANKQENLAKVENDFLEELSGSLRRWVTSFQT
jgi:hypothetical protein